MFIRKGAILAFAVVGASSAQAFVSLSPGGAVLVPDLGLPPSTLEAYRSDALVGMNALGETLFTGYVESFVFRETAGNLLFGYIVHNDLTSIDEISAVSMTDFGGFSTAVGQDPFASASSLSPATSATRSASGGTITFNFDRLPLGRGSLEQGTASYGLMIRTDATVWKRGTVSAINGGIATVESYAPTVVPEPASMAALAVGAATLLRRRRKA